MCCGTSVQRSAATRAASCPSCEPSCPFWTEPPRLETLQPHTRLPRDPGLHVSPGLPRSAWEDLRNRTVRLIPRERFALGVHWRGEVTVTPATASFYWKSSPAALRGARLHRASSRLPHLLLFSLKNSYALYSQRSECKAAPLHTRASASFSARLLCRAPCRPATLEPPEVG